MTTVQVRIEEKTKKAAQKVFAKHGLDLSSGIRLYLSEVVSEQDLPMAWKPSKRLQKAIAEAEREWKSGKVRMYKNVEEALAALDS